MAIYSKEALKTTEVDIEIDGIRDHAWIEVITDKQPLLIGCVYRSPSFDFDKTRCTQSTKSISELILTAFNRNTNLLIAGDFNYKHIDWINDCTPPEKDHLAHFIKKLQDCHLYQHVTEPTRYRENEIPSLLDLILSTEEGMVQDLTYLPPLGESDHVCLRFTLPLCQNINITTSREPNVFKTNYQAVKNELSMHNWRDELNSNFVSDYHTFFDHLLLIMDKHTPLKAQPKTKKGIYMTNEAIRLKNAKARLWKRYLSTRTKFDRENYIRCKNKLRALTRKLQKDLEHNIALTAKEKPKLFWKYAKSKLKTKQRIPTLTKADGSKATSSIEKSNTLNDYFTSVFTIEDLQNIPTLSIYHIEENLPSIEISPDLVRNKLKALNPNKSPGHDNWHPYFLRELANEICVPLSILFKKSLKEGAHESWRKAIITTIYKKGLRSDPGNYRPISITSVISKMMESIVRDAIVTHMMKHELFTDDQHGFVPGRDCITQLL